MEVLIKQKKNVKVNNKITMFLPSVIAAILLIIIGQIISPGFLSMNNLSSILMSASLLALMSMAQNTVIMAGNDGIDLSVGAVASMTALLCPALPMNNILQFMAAVFIVLAIGAVFGLINGLGTQFFKVPALIMTLVISSVVFGFTMLVTRGQPAINISKLLLSISMVIVSPIRILTLIVIILLIGGEIVLIKTRFGRMLRLIGDNSRAAFISGINIKKIRLLSFVTSGAIAGLVGMLLVGYAGSTTMKMAVGYTLLSVAAVAIGGTNLAGGRGSYIGGGLGALVIIILNSILQALNMSAGNRAVIQGTLLLIIVLFNSRSSKLRQ